MKCPKCQYLTFDQGDRCRNCGYEFALVVDGADLDLPIRTGEEPLGPFADFALGEGDAHDRVSVPPPPPVEPRAARTVTPPELPLFHGGPGDAPLVNLPASPRAPMSVRRAPPARPAGRRAAEDEPTLDLEGEAAAETPPVRARRLEGQPDAARDAAAQPASVGARLVGAAIDLALMGGIDIAVLYFTLQLVELTVADAGVIPKAPFAAFVGLLNGGYMTAFTAAGGQSIGKMVAGTRVVTSDAHVPDDRVTLGQSALRAVGYLVSALPAGLGFAPALIGPDHRALHDRLAHTRVVKA